MIRRSWLLTLLLFSILASQALADSYRAFVRKDENGFYLQPSPVYKNSPMGTIRLLGKTQELARYRGKYVLAQGTLEACNKKDVCLRYERLQLEVFDPLKSYKRRRPHFL